MGIEFVDTQEIEPAGGNVGPTHSFTIQARHAPTVLPRVALLFSKRRLVIERLEMYLLACGTRASVGIDAQCDRLTADQVALQIGRIAEVEEVDVSTSGRATPVRLAQ